MEVRSAEERIWRFVPGTENFLIELNCDTPPSQLPYSTQLDFLRKQLEACWKSSFDKHACYLQAGVQFGTLRTTNYFELVDKILCKLKESQEPFWKKFRIESSSDVLVVSVTDESLTLLEVLKFCPGRLNDERSLLFVLFQVIEAVLRLHQCGIPHLGLKLSNLFIDHNYRCFLGAPDLTALRHSHNLGFRQRMNTDADTDLLQDKNSYSSELACMTMRWVLNQCSNYDYLMYLNRLAGRTKGDPMNSAILPWVTDFTVPNAGLRDLTKSKYHLAKGEAQLDANYQAFVHEHTRMADEGNSQRPMVCSVDHMEMRYEDRMNELIGARDSLNRATLDGGDVTDRQLDTCFPNFTTATTNPPSRLDRRISDVFQPHHLLDMMPNLAYYTYMARRTPKEILTRFVRPIYQPNEFPPNMARLYELTPEECIPEFFTDPSVFSSIHTDMPDLGLPKWCANPVEFTAYHLSVLESEDVSAKLHHWIDLTFGYKLIGDAAVQAKNVHLELAGTQNTPRRSGITCLFRTPHPRRWVPSIHSGAYFGPWCSHFRSDVQKPPLICDLRSNTETEKREHDRSQLTFSPAGRTVTSPSNPSESRIDSNSATLTEQVSNNQTSVAGNPDSCHKSHSAPISLPSDYDPLALIRTYEGLCRFLAAETRHPDGFELPPFPDDLKQPFPSLTNLFARDVEAIACLAVELFTHSVANYAEAPCWSHAERFAFAFQMLRLHRDNIPRCLHRGLDLILGPIQSVYTSPVNNGNRPSSFCPSAWHLLHLLFEFPNYFFDLHQAIRWFSLLTPDKADSSCLLPRPLWGPLSVALLGAYYPSLSASHVIEPCQIDKQVLSLLYPHMQSGAAKQPKWLLRTMQTDDLWAFFYTVGGTQAVEKYLVPLLLRLYRSDYSARLAQSHQPGDQHPLSALCARRFLRLVLAYVSLDTFLLQVAPHVICVLLTPSISLFSSDPDSSVEPTIHRPTSTLETRTATGCITTCEQSTVQSILPARRSHGLSSSSLIDEIGFDLRSVDTEDDFLLDLILNQPEPLHARSLSVCSSSLHSTKSHESAGVRFSVDSPLMKHETTCIGPSQPADDSTELCRDSRRSDNSDPQSMNYTSPKHWSSVLTQNAIPPVVASTDSVIWLAKRVGPLITARTLVRYLLTGLTACYEDSSQLAVLLPSPEGLSSTPKSYLPMPVQATNRPLVGDRSSAPCLRCLEQLVCVYGISFVQHMYVPFVEQAVSRALASNTGTTESTDSSAELSSTSSWDAHVLAKVVAALTFMHQFITYLPDSYLSDHLQDSTLTDILILAIRLAGRHDVTFPAGASGRRAVLYKIVDCVYVIGLRIGFELTRARFTSLFQLFFAMFDRVPLVEIGSDSRSHQRTDSASTCVSAATIESKISQSMSCEQSCLNMENDQFLRNQLQNQTMENLETENQAQHVTSAFKPAVPNELRQTFDADLARLAYVPFCRLAGGSYIDTCLYNAEWIHTLIGTRSVSLSGIPVSCSLPASDSAFHTHKPRGDLNIADNQSLSNFNPINVASGQFGYSYREELNLIASSALYYDGVFHLRGAWSEVFQRELSEHNDAKPRDYRFHGIRVASFAGHTARINSLDIFPNKSSFLTTSHDKTVQLWSISDSYNPTYLAPEPVSLKGLSPNAASATNVHGLVFLSSSACRNTSSGSVPISQSLLARLIYRDHRKPVFAAIYLPTYRLVASTDGRLILWDPCTGQKVHSGIPTDQSLTALARCFVPGGAVLCADHNGLIYLVDPRTSGSSEQRSSLKLSSGASLASIVFARDRLKSGSTAATAPKFVRDPNDDACRWITRSSGDTFSSQLKQLAIELDPRLSGPGSPAPYVASAPGSAGSLRQLAQDAHSSLVFCGFSSGFATALDLRNGQVVHAWRAHSDSIVQVGSWKPTWFASSGGRSLAFWHLTRSGRMDSVRTIDHCVPQMVDGDGSDHSSIPGMSSIAQFACYGDQLIVCGPGSVSGTGSAEYSSNAQPSSSKSSQMSSSGISSSTSANNLLGLYRSSQGGRPSYTALGPISSGLLRGRVTALSSLPESGLLLAGSTHGHVALMY